MHVFSRMAVSMCVSMLLAMPMAAQLAFPGAAQTAKPNLLSDPTMQPGKALLYELEAKFAKDVAERGGEAFAAWFADDGVALGNGVSPLRGREAIARSAKWSPKNYLLAWTPTDAVMSPSGDMGYTWGHYEGTSTDANGVQTKSSGRYMTIWRRQADGQWKVVLDAGSNDAPESDDCCKVKP